MIQPIISPNRSWPLTVFANLTRFNFFLNGCRLLPLKRWYFMVTEQKQTLIKKVNKNQFSFVMSKIWFNFQLEFRIFSNILKHSKNNRHISRYIYISIDLNILKQCSENLLDDWDFKLMLAVQELWIWIVLSLRNEENQGFIFTLRKLTLDLSVTIFIAIVNTNITLSYVFVWTNK